MAEKKVQALFRRVRRLLELKRLLAESQENEDFMRIKARRVCTPLIANRYLRQAENYKRASDKYKAEMDSLRRVK